MQHKTAYVCFHGRGQTADMFKSLTKSLSRTTMTLGDNIWVYMQGKYPVVNDNDNGWAWYDDNKTRENDLIDVSNIISKYKLIVLMGFSEGAQFALELAYICQNIKGVVAISPSFDSKFISKNKICVPVILITSHREDKISKKYAEKWKKCIDSACLTQIDHDKGHKVYLPANTRNVITNLFYS
jgi:predicted esterase